MFFSTNKHKILIVAKDHYEACLLEEKLRTFGFEVVGTTSQCEEATSLIHSNSPALLLLDEVFLSELSSPTISSHFFYQLSLPVVLIQNQQSQLEIDKQLLKKIFGFVRAPFIDHELRTAIELALYKHNIETQTQLNELTIQSITQGVFVTNPQQEIISSNLAFQQQTGYSNKELLGQTCALIQGPLTDDLTKQAIALAKQEGQPFYGEILNYRKDGSTFWNEISIIPRFNEQHVLSHFIITNIDITERKNTLDALRQSESDLLETERTTQVGHWTWDTKNKSIKYSNEMMRIWQRDLSAFNSDIIELILSTVHVDDQELVKLSFQDAFKDKVHYEAFEYRILLPDGSSRTIWAKTGRKQFDQSGNIIRLNGTVQDITKRKQIEEERRLNDARMEQAFGKSPIGMVLINIAGRVLRVNQALSTMIGYAEDELLHKDWRCFAHVDDLYTDRHLMQELLEGKSTSYQFDKRMIHKDQKEVWVHLNVSLVRDQFDLPINIIVQIQDISQKRTDEAQIRQLSQAIEQSKDAIALCQINGDIEYVNETFISNENKEKDQIIGTSFSLYASEKTSPSQFDKLWSSLHSGHIWKGEFTTQLTDGTKKIEFVTISPIRQLDGVITHFVSNQEDITEKKKLGLELDQHRHHLEELVESRTKELEAAHKLAEAANLAKSQFIANMSHEIRTPMHGVLGWSQLALNNTTDLVQRDYLERINSSGDHLIRIVNDILDFSKIEAGKMKFELADFSIRALLYKVENLVLTKVDKSKIDLIFEIQPDVPPYLFGDSHRLSQVLLNYMYNAIKFTEKGSIKLSISKISENNDTCFIRMEVTDTGIGMSPEQQERLFQSFEQADSSTTRKYGGTGLGLAICKEIAQMMQGEVGVKSQIGEGSTFWCTAQLQRAKAPELIDQQQSAQEDYCLQLKEINKRARPLHILLVDDFEFNRQIGEEILRNIGCQVTLAQDGKEALDLLETTQFDCVLMDIQMPVMDGLEASRQIRLHPSLATLPIIAMTANAMNDDRLDCLSAGMNDFISKPYTTQALYKTIYRWVNHSINDEIEKENMIHPSDEESPLSIDLNSLAVLVNHSAEKVKHFSFKFIESSQQGLKQMRDALEKSNFASLSAIGHQLKSSSRTVGAEKFAQLCTQLESMKTHPSLTIASKILEQLETEVVLIEKDMHVYFEQASFHFQNAQLSTSNLINETIDALTLNPQLHVLVLEDDPVVNDITCDNLKRYGIKFISSCTDGHQALLIVNQHPPDMMICDLNMAIMDGISFLRSIAELSYQGGIIILSSADKGMMRAAENLVKAYGLNLLATLSKPFDSSKMVKALNTQLNPTKKQRLFHPSAVLTLDELNEGLDNHYIELFYQPKISIHDNSVKGAECLARWRHPTRGLLTPDTFIGPIEEFGLIDALTIEVLKKSASQLKIWNQQGHFLLIAVNVSMDNLNQADLPEQFETIVKNAGLLPSQFILELTESRLLANLTLSLEILTRLRLKGFALSIDDFGTAFSTMENLKQLPFTELKIDRTFVNGASKEEESKGILQSSIHLGKIFNLNIVAEGVENQQDWDFVAESGCDDIQGYFVTKPLPPTDFIDWKQSWENKHTPKQ